MALSKAQVIELARVSDPDTGFEYFLSKYVYIQDQREGAIPFQMWPTHKETCQVLRQQKFIVLLKARQVGCSWSLGAAYPLWRTMFFPGRRALLFSQREQEAAELINKVRFVHARLPDWMKVPFSKDNALALVFGGLESEILAFSGSEHAGSGYSASLVVSDEWAKQEYAERQFAAIRPTIDMGGQFIGLSTAAGPGTFHAKVWHEARKGINGFYPHFIPYNAHPERDEEWWERMRLTYPQQWVWHQEYPRNAEEAIQSSAPTVFPRTLELLAYDQPFSRDQLKGQPHPDWETLSKITPRRGEAGLRVYQLPTANRQYAIGADVAEGQVSGDAQAAVVLDLESGEEVAALHGSWSIPDYARYLVSLATVYGGAILAPERNNHGMALILEIKREQVERARRKAPCKFELYHDKPLLDAAGHISKPGKPGFLTSRATKPVLITDLKEALEQDEIRLASPALLEELMLYQQNEDGSYSAPPGYHDDLVMALGICNQMRLKPRARSRPSIPYAMGASQATVSKFVVAQDAPNQETPLDTLLSRMRRSRDRRERPNRSSYLRRRQNARMI